jgi:hypothetical protein
MKRIGTIAAKLIANPIELVAAANQKRGIEFEGGGTTFSIPICRGRASTPLGKGGVLVVCNDGRGLPMPPRKRDFAGPGSRPSLRIVGGRDHAAPRSMTL